MGRPKASHFVAAKLIYSDRPDFSNNFSMKFQQNRYQFICPILKLNVYMNCAVVN